MQIYLHTIITPISINSSILYNTYNTTISLTNQSIDIYNYKF